MAMGFDAIVVCALLVLAVALFVSELLPVDAVAVLVMACLMLSGVLTPKEGLAGFSHEATVTIAAMFVLSEGIRRTGALNALGDLFIRVGRQSYWQTLILLMPLIGLISAFVNNTAAVAIFIPVMLRVAGETGVSPSKLLMPLSFAAMFGGVCTLIGTSTNILVSSLAEDYGIRPFGMFEFLPLGLVIFVAGALYLLVIGVRTIPERRRRAELSQNFEMEGYLTDVVLEADFEYLGDSVQDLAEEWDLEILLVFRGEETLRPEKSGLVLQEGDALRIHGSAAQIEELLQKENLVVQPVQSWLDNERLTEDYSLIEVVIAPDSELAGRKIGDVHFLSRFGARVLAVRRRGRLTRVRLRDFRLAGGDSLLLTAERGHLREIQENRSFVVVSEVAAQPFRRRRMPIAIAILAAVISAAAFDLVPIVVAAMTGVVVLLLSGCLNPQEVYKAIQWRVIFLLAGVIPLGRALEKTGIAEWLADQVISLAGPFGPVAVVSGVFLISMLLTEIISNQATAALLVPIVIQTAADLGVDPRPLLLAITFAASLSFMTPVGYQTNTLIYGPGQYRFTDFTRVGAPLNLIFWILGTLLIPVFWPL